MIVAPLTQNPRQRGQRSGNAATPMLRAAEFSGCKTTSLHLGQFTRQILENDTYAGASTEVPDRLVP
jgi:hypothetical protein